MKKILVTGANGQLGSELRQLSNIYPKWHFIFTDVEELDLCNEKALVDFFDKHRPHACVNCAAFTAVDKAESEQELAYAINHLAVENLAKNCQKIGTIFIHISSDYVYHNTFNLPLTEDAPTLAQSVYAKSKLAGDQAALYHCESSYIIRTSWVYSAYGHNFVRTMLRLGKERPELRVVSDQIGTPTYAYDLGHMILHMIDKTWKEKLDVFGIYHYSNTGVCSWFDFAKTIFEMAALPVEVTPISSSEYLTPASRPFYSVLDKTKIQQNFDLSIPYWKDSLTVCLAAMGEAPGLLA